MSKRIEPSTKKKVTLLCCLLFLSRNNETSISGLLLRTWWCSSTWICQVLQGLERWGKGTCPDFHEGKQNSCAQIRKVSWYLKLMHANSCLNKCTKCKECLRSIYSQQSREMIIRKYQISGSDENIKVGF